MPAFNDLQTLSTASSAATAVQILTNETLWDATCTVTDTTPAAKTFVYLSGNNFTITAHGFLTGLKVVNTTTGALPTGLSGAAEYVIVVDANTVAFATSQANALAGTAIAISGAGTGTQTSTPQALAGTLVFQKTNNSTIGTPTPTPVWVTITTPTTAATQNVSATSLNYYDSAAGYCGLRALLTITSGQATVAIRMNGKGF